MNNLNLSALADQATRQAVTAAKDYLRAHGHPINSDTLIPHLQREVRAAIGPALDDVREAHEAGMTGYIVPTFLASMSLAGIAAAKAAVGE